MTHIKSFTISTVYVVQSVFKLFITESGHLQVLIIVISPQYGPGKVGLCRQVVANLAPKRILPKACIFWETAPNTPLWDCRFSFVAIATLRKENIGCKF